MAMLSYDNLIYWTMLRYSTDFAIAAFWFNAALSGQDLLLCLYHPACVQTVHRNQNYHSHFLVTMHNTAQALLGHAYRSLVACMRTPFIVHFPVLLARKHWHQVFFKYWMDIGTMKRFAFRWRQHWSSCQLQLSRLYVWKKFCEDLVAVCWSLFFVRPSKHKKLTDSQPRK